MSKRVTRFAWNDNKVSSCMRRELKYIVRSFTFGSAPENGSNIRQPLHIGFLGKVVVSA